MIDLKINVGGIDWSSKLRKPSDDDRDYRGTGEVYVGKSAQKYG